MHDVHWSGAGNSFDSGEDLGLKDAAKIVTTLAFICFEINLEQLIKSFPYRFSYLMFNSFQCPCEDSL